MKSKTKTKAELQAEVEQLKSALAATEKQRDEAVAALTTRSHYIYIPYTPPLNPYYDGTSTITWTVH